MSLKFTQNLLKLTNVANDFTKDAVVLVDKNNNPVVFPEGHKFAGQEAAFMVDQKTEADKQTSFDYLMEILKHFNLIEGMVEGVEGGGGGGGGGGLGYDSDGKKNSDKK